eukprot:4196262-Lingulodinium_polyedra.AAC.1
MRKHGNPQALAVAAPAVSPPRAPAPPRAAHSCHNSCSRFAASRKPIPGHGSLWQRTQELVPPTFVKQLVALPRVSHVGDMGRFLGAIAVR